MIKLIESKCQFCLEIFMAQERELKRGNAKYCSRSCSHKGMRLTKLTKGVASKEPNVHCAQCSKAFYRNDSKLKNSKSGLQFCSRTCKDTAQRIGGVKEIQPPHYGEVSTRYRNLAFRHFEKMCMHCGYSKYPEVLQVHHKDKDRTNNTLENLEVLCPTCHEVHHFLDASGRFSKKTNGELV